MPAAAVIPAPIAYIKVVAVKKLVVDNRRSARRYCSRRHCLDGALHMWFLASAPWKQGRSVIASVALQWVIHGGPCVYFEEIRVFKAGYL